MTDDRHPPGDGDTPDPDVEAESGDLVESEFEVEEEEPSGPIDGDLPDSESGDPAGEAWAAFDGSADAIPGAGHEAPATGEGDDDWPWAEPGTTGTGPAGAGPEPALGGAGPEGPVATPGDDDLGLGAVPADDGGWDPPPATDAMFAPEEYGAPAPGAGSEEPGGFGPWHEGLEPYPEGDQPAPATGSAHGGAHPSDPGPADAVADAVPAPDEAVERWDAVDVEAMGDVPPMGPAGGVVPGEVEAEPPGEAPSPTGGAGPGDGEPDELADWASFTDEHYIRVSQADYRELADLGADEPDAAPSAVAANIPGLESGVVGLEDVADEPAVEERGPAPAPPSASDLGLRALTAVGLLVLFAAALVHPIGLTVVAVILFGLAAGEFYAVLVRSGQHPLSLFGLIGAVAGLVGSAVWGVGAIAVAIIGTLVTVALYYALTSAHSDPLTDGGLTVMVVAWALLGAFVFPIIDSAEYRWWIAAIVVVVVVMDVGQYFAGRSMGSHPLAPVVSPKKTIEGLVGGAAATLVAAVALSFLGPLTLPSMLALAAATIVLAPLGDLSVSLVKRIIGVKDMGTILPGHGGILDRIDSLLFVVPAAWVIFDGMGLIG